MIKRVLFVLAAMTLLVAGYAMAQSSTTSAPGPTLQREPGTANNDLPNPGNPQTRTDPSTQSANPPATATDTGTTGTMDQEQAGTTGTTDTTGTTGTTGTVNGQNDGTGTAGGGLDSTGSTLPATGSELPLLGLVGLTALGAAAGLRRFNS